MTLSYIESEKLARGPYTAIAQLKFEFVLPALDVERSIFLDLVYKSELALLDAVIFNSYHVLRLVFPCSPPTSWSSQLILPPLSCHPKILRTSYPVPSIQIPPLPLLHRMIPSISVLHFLPSY